MKPRRSPRLMARCLCASCGRRFSSTKSFDGHRDFEPGRKGDWAARGCLDPAETKGFESQEGFCNLAGEEIPVPVWGLTAHREQARAAFRKRKREAKRRAATPAESIRGNAGRPPRARTVQAVG